MQFPQQIVRQLIISYDTGGTAISIGPGPQIIVYNSTGDEIVRIGVDGDPDDPMVRVQDVFGEANITMHLDTTSGDPIIDFVGYTGPHESGIPATIYALGQGVPGTTARLFFEFRSGVGGNTDTSRFMLRSASADATITARILADKPIIYWDPADIAGVGEVWHNVVFANGWANLGGNWATAQYRLMPDGTVLLKGSVIGGTKVDGTVMTTLPVGYRPANDHIYMGGNASAAGSTPSVRIFTSGQIQIFAMNATVNGAHSWDGIRFPLVGALS